MATGATQNYFLPYPLSTDPVRVAGDIEQLATKIDDLINEELAIIIGQDITSLGTVTVGTWAATPIAANKGGTGLTSYTTGDILYASSSSTLSKLTAVGEGSALISGGVSSAPSWGKIGLTTHVVGTLPVGNGGTGVTTSTGTGSVVLSTSPTLSGTPLAPTAANGTNTTQIATTEFVQSSLVSVFPSQEGNSGKILTTNGTSVSWTDTIDGGTP